MLIYIKESFLPLMDGGDGAKDGETFAVWQHIKESLKDSLSSNGPNLPQAMTVLLPDGQGILTAAHQGQNGADSDKPANQPNGFPASSESLPLRGAQVSVSVPDPDNATVKDMIDILLEQAHQFGHDVLPPPRAQFIAIALPDEFLVESDVEETEEYKPAMALCVTQCRNHHISNIHDASHPLSQVETTYLLRLEWFDANPHAYRVPVCHCSPASNSFRWHGDPFLVAVYKGEKVGSVRKRIATWLSVDSEEIAEWEMMWYNNQQNFPCEDEDEELVWNPALLQRFSLVLVRDPDPDGPGPRDFWAPSPAHIQQQRSGIRIQTD
eukprot:CAMPEP_0184306864 /NCGR_PEP_ID=MMETSP1049-20130417/15750_1 /TAXON_ID=77928 /ORGANISM="Proteomonas sulcata, Strain CCMP704" /LENGTH=323 /DNA_ID=CAMNT_0026619219 /DNA_START=66 /DNA_END=1037 /DNA_ORIENTATION=+